MAGSRGSGCREAALTARPRRSRSSSRSSRRSRTRHLIWRVWRSRGSRRRCRVWRCRWPPPMPPATNGSELPVGMAPAWFDVDPGGEPTSGSLAVVTVGGSELLIANVDGTLLAYRDACAHCGGALHEGVLADGALRCPQCERS